MCDNWSVYEFQNLELGDSRFNARSIKIHNSTYNNINSSIPHAFANFTETTATYRCFNNLKVTYQKFLEAHLTQTVERINEIESVDTNLAVQNTTSIDLTNKNISKCLGCLKT